jgi:hypothetical protein
MGLEGLYDEVGYAHAGSVGKRRWFGALAMPGRTAKVERGNL